MKESVQIAFTYAKVSDNHYPIHINQHRIISILIHKSYQTQNVLSKSFLETDADPGNEFLYNNSIHLHVPEGATPKVSQTFSLPIFAFAADNR